MTRYLFRFDMNKENDQFLVLSRTQGVDQVYSGIEMKIGPGWIPDYCEVTVDDDGTGCTLTLIELETKDITARESCRKYLPEASSGILQAFVGYLQNVLESCRSTADSRFDAFEKLHRTISTSGHIIVRTAAALRTSAELVESFPLIDQPECPVVLPHASPEMSDQFLFDGVRRLSRVESDGVRRAIRILHAVIVGRDHSGGSMKSWRNVRDKPLDSKIKKEPARYPHLQKLLASETKNGLLADCDKLATELATLWTPNAKGSMTPDRAKRIVAQFYPRAVGFAGHEPMQKVFEQAREVMENLDL